MITCQSCGGTSAWPFFPNGLNSEGHIDICSHMKDQWSTNHRVFLKGTIIIAFNWVTTVLILEFNC